MEGLFLAMIYNNNFVWVHLPKTGGTTVHNLFKAMNIPIFVDDNDSKQTRLTKTS